MYTKDNRIVATLDAGGTNFVFGAMQAGEFITPPITIPSQAHDLDLCLQNMVNGFSQIISNLQEKRVRRPCALGCGRYERGHSFAPHVCIAGELPLTSIGIPLIARFPTDMITSPLSFIKMGVAQNRDRITASVFRQRTSRQRKSARRRNEIASRQSLKGCHGRYLNFRNSRLPKL